LAVLIGIFYEMHTNELIESTMNKIVIGILILLLAVMGYVFVQYQSIAGDAEEQVAKDIRFLEDSYHDRSSTSLTGEYLKMKHIQTQLVLQSVNADKQFVRHYHSLFIENGVKQCLQSQVIYLQRQTTILQQSWLENPDICLP
jgi:hypothetical protein